MPFTGFKAIDKKVQGGKQIKAEGTGEYISANGDLFYIKRSESFPNDDLAEYISSGILTALVGEAAAKCDLVRNTNTNEVFLASQIAAGSGHDFLQQQGKISGCWSEEERKNVYKKLSAKNLINIFAKTLAACMIVCDYDVHPGNFILYTDRANNNKICKIDHGWGLHNICLVDNNEIMQPKPPAGMYGNTFRFMPINHFSNYSELIYTEEFRRAIDEVLDKFKKIDIRKNINHSISKINQMYPNNYKKQLELFLLIAVHIGNQELCDTLRNPSTQDKDLCLYAKKTITTLIAKSLERRKKGLKKLKGIISEHIIEQSINADLFKDGIVFEKTNFMKENNFLEMIKIISSKSKSTSFFKKYAEFPPGCTLHFKKSARWFEFTLGPKWQLIIKDADENLICTVNYYKPGIFFKFFGIKEQLRFLSNYKYPRSLELTVQFAKKLNIQPKKIPGYNSFSTKDIRRALHNVDEKRKFNKSMLLEARNKRNYTLAQSISKCRKRMNSNPKSTVTAKLAPASKKVLLGNQKTYFFNNNDNKSTTKAHIQDPNSTLNSQAIYEKVKKSCNHIANNSNKKIIVLETEEKIVLEKTIDKCELLSCTKSNLNCMLDIKIPIDTNTVHNLLDQIKSHGLACEIEDCPDIDAALQLIKMPSVSFTQAAYDFLMLKQTESLAEDKDNDSEYQKYETLTNWHKAHTSKLRNSRFKL